MANNTAFLELVVSCKRALDTMESTRGRLARLDTQERTMARCSYCGGTFKADAYGNCKRCGGTADKVRC